MPLAACGTTNVTGRSSVKLSPCNGPFTPAAAARCTEMQGVLCAGHMQVVCLAASLQSAAANRCVSNSAAWYVGAHTSHSEIQSASSLLWLRSITLGVLG